MIENNIKFFKNNILYLSLGIILMSFIFWNRLIRIRLPRTLEDFTTNNYLQFILYLNIFILSIVICTTLSSLLNLKNDKHGFIFNYLSKNNLVTRLISYGVIINNTLKKSPKTVYELLFQLYNVAHILERPFLKISLYLQELPQIKLRYVFPLIYLLCHTIPKFIPVIVFLSEIFIVQELHYFYKSLGLLLLPMIYNALCWILRDLSDKNIYYATAHIEVVYQSKDEYTAILRKEVPKIEDAVDIIKHKNNTALLDWFVYVYETYCNIKWLVYHLEEIKKKLSSYETIVYCSLYLIGWFKILLYIL